MVVVFAMILGCGGVYAVWYYNAPFVEEFSAATSLILNDFFFAPDVVLPGTDQDSDLGKNHQSLLHEILYSSKYGLNLTETIHANMAQYGDMITCYENGIQGGNMNNIPRAGNLGFVLTCEREADEIVSFFLYTFDEFSSYINDSKIVVYKTMITKNENGEWESPISWEGYVVASQETVAIHKKEYYILPAAWKSGRVTA